MAPRAWSSRTPTALPGGAGPTPNAPARDVGAPRKPRRVEGADMGPRRGVERVLPIDRRDPPVNRHPRRRSPRHPRPAVAPRLEGVAEPPDAVPLVAERF